MPSDVRTSAGCGERSNVEDRGTGETADADQQRAGPTPGQSCYCGNHMYIVTMEKKIRQINV